MVDVCAVEYVETLVIVELYPTLLAMVYDALCVAHIQSGVGYGQTTFLFGWAEMLPLRLRSTVGHRFGLAPNKKHKKQWIQHRACTENKREG